ncbi:hypothetical protein AAEX28_13215 [Lentisphaerota bacterium WC36G]|nr:hypothetical protein LJT99_16045 [Lentisphaerae bacterium WC36]
MKLATNSINFTIPGKNMEVSIAQSFDRKNLSAQSSSTSTASSGDKPQKIKVSCQIPLSDRDKYRELKEISSAKNSNGDPTVYDIVDPTCFDNNIMQVIFVGTFSCKRDKSLQCYNVSFSLQEFNSVAEKREKREVKKEITPAQVPGKAISNDEMLSQAQGQLNNRF